MDNIIDLGSLPFFEDDDMPEMKEEPVKKAPEPEKETKQQSTFLLIKPTSIAEADEIIRYIETKQAALLDLSDADMKVKQRILDFVAGAAYALNCNMERVSKDRDQYLISPHDMMVVVQKSEK